MSIIGGPAMPARLVRLISAPWMRPWTSGPTWRVISACVAGHCSATSAWLTQLTSIHRGKLTGSSIT